MVTRKTGLARRVIKSNMNWRKQQYFDLKIVIPRSYLPQVLKQIDKTPKLCQKKWIRHQEAALPGWPRSSQFCFALIILLIVSNELIPIGIFITAIMLNGRKLQV